MTIYVRERMTDPASKEHACRRRELNRERLAPDPARPGDRFDAALDWFRAAARYAGRRSYRRLEIGERAVACCEQFRAEAAQVVQAAADEIASPIPASFRPGPVRAQIRDASRKAATPKEQLDLARAWQMYAYRLACRYARRDGGEAQARAGLIRDAAAARLIDWAEEMDSDSYGE
jgi:hypothetical protein